VLEGPIESHLDSIVDQVEGSPLLAFFDPFGLGIPFDMLTGRVLGRATGVGRATTEVLLNLSVPGIERNAGHLKEPTTTHAPYHKARETILARLDASLGGAWWREIWSSGSKGAIDQIVSGYWDRLKGAAGGWGSWLVPVSDRWGGPPSYYLIFLSKHPDGLWAFSETLSLAKEEYFDFCHRDQLQLETNTDRWARWSATIARNIEQMLAEGNAFRVRDRANEVYGETLGEARERHIRAAIKQLYKEGKTSTPGTGDIPSMVIVPGSQAGSSNSSPAG
jgi:hypothetical protein